MSVGDGARTVGSVDVIDWWGGAVGEQVGVGDWVIGVFVTGCGVFVEMAVGMDVAAGTLGSSCTTSGNVSAVRSMCFLYLLYPAASTISTPGLSAYKESTNILANPLSSVMSSRGALPLTSIMTFACRMVFPVSAAST